MNFSFTRFFPFFRLKISCFFFFLNRYSILLFLNRILVHCIQTLCRNGKEKCIKYTSVNCYSTPLYIAYQCDLICYGAYNQFEIVSQSRSRAQCEKHYSNHRTRKYCCFSSPPEIHTGGDGRYNILYRREEYVVKSNITQRDDRFLLLFLM